VKRRMRSFAKRGFSGTLFRARQIAQLDSLPQNPHHQLLAPLPPITMLSRTSQRTAQVRPSPRTSHWGPRCANRLLMPVYRRSCGARSLHDAAHPWSHEVRWRQTAQAHAAPDRRQQWPRSTRTSSSPPSSAASTPLL
jgi:hypothetical protein